MQRPVLVPRASTDLQWQASCETQGRSPTWSRRNSGTLREQRGGDATGEVCEHVSMEQ